MKRSVSIIIPALAAGLILGWLFFHPSPGRNGNMQQGESVSPSGLWTCAMHPQIRMDAPGKCPICGMELIPVEKDGKKAYSDPETIHLSGDELRLAGIQTTTVSKKKAVRELRLFGKIKIDERSLQSQVAHIAGRIEKLNVNFTGESVHKGEILAEIYSPELLRAQQELIETSKLRQSDPAIYEAALEKLRLLKISDKQITSIEESGIVTTSVDIISNTDGLVISRRVSAGDYVSKGSVLFDIADLSSVWVSFDAYESDLRFLRKGQKVDFTVQALPGNKFSGKIIFVDPVLDPSTRVAGVRVESSNPGGSLKPEMFVSGVVMAEADGDGENIVIPGTAVLWTGKRSLVYVSVPEAGENVFKMREITLGTSLGDSYIVADGLSEGEEIVTNGTFSLDAAAQLQGKPSMMNVKQTPAPGVHRATFKAEGNCELCRDRIEKAALSVPGVENAVWDVKTKIISAEFDQTKTDQAHIEKAVAKAGHDTELFKADDVTYKSLPECCHYRKVN